MGEAGAKAEGEEKNRGEGLLSLRDGWSSHCCKGAPGQSSKPGGRKGTFKKFRQKNLDTKMQACGYLQLL